MSTQWKPGTFAMVQRNGADWHPAIYTDDHEWVCLHGLRCGPSGVRPLVAIDPEDREQVERLGNALAIEVARDLETDSGARTIIRDAVAPVLRSLLAPPKPDEPQGLGADVEDADGVLWVQVRTDFRRAFRQASGEHTGRSREYQNIDAVKVLSEGIQT
jgi:hypothetical protein